MRIDIDDLSSLEVADFLAAHVEEMRSVTPPGSKHALDLDGLRKPEVTFWTVMDGKVLAGCGAIKAIDPSHAEIKSMRIAPEYRGRGVASLLMQHIFDEAKEMGFSRLSLETGSFEFFLPARKLYEKFGFDYCEPFAGYVKDPNSVHMVKVLRA